MAGLRSESGSPGQAAEVAVYQAVGEGPADGLAGNQDPVIDRPDQLVHVGGHVGAGRELAAGDRAVQRQTVAAATFVATGLDDVITALEGDARETLAGLGVPPGLVLLDGWKDLCLPVLHLLEPSPAPW